MNATLNFLGRDVTVVLVAVPGGADRYKGKCVAIGVEGVAFYKDTALLLIPWHRVEEIVLRTDQ
jgi:hypothetical protein